MAFAILADERLGFRVGQILDALLGTEVEFDPDALISGIEGSCTRGCRKPCM